MFRRANGRPPPALLGGLILVILILSFSYWTLNTQNNDALQTLERFKANLKIGDEKIDQSQRKMSALQDVLHEKEDQLKQSNDKLLQQEDDIRAYNDDLKKRDSEIESLKEDIEKLNEKIESVESKNRECENDNEKILRENDLLISQRDDAVLALNQRDEQINELSKKLQQEAGRCDQLAQKWMELSKGYERCSAQLDNAKLQLAAVGQQPQGSVASLQQQQGGSADGQQQQQRHNLDRAAAAMRPLGPGQLPVMQQPLSVRAADKGREGISFHGEPLLIRDPPNAPRPRPRFSVLNDIESVNNVGVAPPPLAQEAHPAIIAEQQAAAVLPQPGDVLMRAIAPSHDNPSAAAGGAGVGSAVADNPVQAENQPRDVLLPPNFNDNLDVAVDENNHLADDPLNPDQDPAGGDVARNEALLEDERVHENRVHDEGAEVGREGVVEHRLGEFGSDNIGVRHVDRVAAIARDGMVDFDAGEIGLRNMGGVAIKQGMFDPRIDDFDAGNSGIRNVAGAAVREGMVDPRLDDFGDVRHVNGGAVAAGGALAAGEAVVRQHDVYNNNNNNRISHDFVDNAGNVVPAVRQSYQLDRFGKSFDNRVNPQASIYDNKVIGQGDGYGSRLVNNRENVIPIVKRSEQADPYLHQMSSVPVVNHLEQVGGVGIRMNNDFLDDTGNVVYSAKQIEQLHGFDNKVSHAYAANGVANIVPIASHHEQYDGFGNKINNVVVDPRNNDFNVDSRVPNAVDPSNNINNQANILDGIKDINNGLSMLRNIPHVDGQQYGVRGLSNPLVNGNEDTGGEVETGVKNQDNPGGEDLNYNGAKENFGDDPPLRLQIGDNQDTGSRDGNVDLNDHSLEDNMMVLQGH